jgi:indole-3-glycerol phosphate synthase
MTGTPDILTTILRRKAQEVAERAGRVPQSELSYQARSAGPPRGFFPGF